MAQIVDALIIGAGPAGLSAALCFGRQAAKCIVFDSGSYRNDATDYMHLIPGLDHAPPAEFRATAGSQITSRYSEFLSIVRGVDVKTAQQTKDGMFEVTDGQGKTWTGRKLILASGVQDCFPDIAGYAECWGKSIFHCLFCKGFEQRSSGSVGVLASPNVPHVLHVARQAAALTDGPVTLYTNGADSLATDLAGSLGTTSRMRTDSRPIKKFVHGGGEGLVIEFADGSEPARERFLAHSPPTKARGAFADQLGLETSPSGDIKVTPPFNQTSLRGVFAAGDNCSMLKTVPNAIFSGNLAGQGALSQLQAELHGQKPLFG